MTKVWPSVLAAWFAALTANGCSVDQRSLGSLGAAQGEAGTAADVFVDGPLDGPLDGPVDGLVDGPVDGPVDGSVDAPVDAPIDGPVDGPVDGLTDSQDALAGEVAPGPEIWVPFGPVSLHPCLANAVASQADPTLTADERELYFSSNPNTDWDIWLCQRASSTALWGTPTKVIELSSDVLDETPEVSADGLSIYLASERAGGVAAGEHLWVSHRATRADPWAQPVPVTDFVGGDRDLSPSLQRDQLMMAFASLRGGDWDLYITTRRSIADPWGTPTALTELNSTAIDWDPALYRGGTSIVFASRRSNPVNSLFHATRASVAGTFSVPQEATEFNFLGNAADPWLSDDGHHIVFDSRGGPTKIYEATR